MSLESFGKSRFLLDIEFDDALRKITLTDTYSGVAFADAEYRYSACVESGGVIHRLEGLTEPKLAEQPWDSGGGRTAVLTGLLGSGDSGVRIAVTHKLSVPDDEEYFDEQIVLRNAGDGDVALRGYRFGFRKLLELPRRYGGPGVDIENYRLIALPFRLQPDGKKHDYQLDDIYHGRFQSAEFFNPARLVQQVVDRGRGRSEGWAWSDGENGLLVLKYNRDAIEFSMLDTEHRDGDVYLTFGGAAPSLYSEPVESRDLAAGGEFAFGKTRYHFYEGLWRRGAYLFREFMSARGHSVPDNYDPPVTWNEIYDIGWHHNNPEALARHYNRETLDGEASKAAEIGCEALYLDPGWEVCEGATIWDEDRLGEVASFVRDIKENHGLKVGFRTVGRSYCDAYPGLYRRRPDGSIGYYAPYSAKPFYEPCFSSEQYRDEKTRRILKVAQAGMDFIMFDEFDWRGACMSAEHGHLTPTTPNLHARAVVEMVRRVKQERPEALIECHDSVWPWGVRYLPVYYLHEPGVTFDEVWAFEFMWNPLDDLLSGRALCLFYYNLAYDIPLYLHINMENDNDNCLAFWWYASTCKHLGIGGKRGDEKRFAAYKDALATYKPLKDLYTRGTFYGMDELTHIHVLPEERKCVVNAFNLTDKPMHREVEVRLNDLGLLEDVCVEGSCHKVVGGKLILKLDIPAFDQTLVRMFSQADM